MIITDLLMPKMNGIEVIMELSRSGSGVPIIAMSGGRRSVAADLNRDSTELRGVSATLAKPFSRADLRLAIQQAVATPLPASGR